MNTSASAQPKASAATASPGAAALDPRLPRIIPRGGGSVPAAPRSLDEAGLEPWILSDLALKLASMVPHVTTDWAADQLHLPPALIDRLFWQLKEEQYIEILGQVDEVNYRCAITPRGREHARRCFEVSGYVGPAPVSLDAYSAMLEWQTANRPQPTYQQVQQRINSALVMPEDAVEVAALAASSGRSLFVFGPPGNGKTSLGRLLHHVIGGELWIPHCISIDGMVIRIFDRQLHTPIDTAEAHDLFQHNDPVDRRWIRIRPPFVVVGGEMTIAELDLAYSPAHRFYEAPPHVKANGGTFLIDDFGRQRIEPHELLNRWIIPLEQRVDHLTMHTGQRIEIPFRLMLVVATNLPVSEVSDPAFLRRMGYRLHLDQPSAELYTAIFRRYAENAGLAVPDGLIPALLQRYKEEGRDLRASEPRDLIERARDLCRLRGQPFSIDPDVMNRAWQAYFGQT
jgi:predicted ATPase with chaperone activity